MGATPLERYDERFLRQLYRKMRLIRDVERRSQELADEGETPGAVHLCLGQEAVATGACLALDDNDLIGGTHRSHGHVLAKGSDVRSVIAEFGGKQTGLNDGRGGDMHLFDPSNGVLETTGIIGANTPHVVGAILSRQLDGDDDVGLSFFGDGAMNQGIVYETMNMASLWDVPVVFLCEDNQYGITTAKEDVFVGEEVAKRASGFDIPSESVDGQDVIAVHEAVSSAVERARNGGGPQFVHCETYRYCGHFSWEDELLGDRPYRTDDEIQKWREARDPIENYKERLVSNGVVSEDDLHAIDASVRDEVESAVREMRDAEQPAGERALEDVYAEQGYENFPAPKYR